MTRSVESAYCVTLDDGKSNRTIARNARDFRLQKKEVYAMAKTISIRIGHGSQNHNSRKFTAKNIDAERTKYNVVLCDERIDDVYHELFDDAVKTYNERQTRSDRMIDDYLSKIRNGRQEKESHEVIIQIGNKDDTPADSAEGEQVKEILKEYYKGFVERNTTLRVYAAYLHMDEATPHIHIDYIPYTSGSKRGLETRVSHKKALADLGYRGGTNRQTEWCQWAANEKKEVEKIMSKYNIKRLDKGEHKRHLDIEDYKANKRHEEVIALGQEIKKLKKEQEQIDLSIEKSKAEVKIAEKKIDDQIRRDYEISKEENNYKNEEQYKPPKPKLHWSAKYYYDNYVVVFFEKLISIIAALRRMIKELKEKIFSLENDKRALIESRDYYINQAKQYKSDSEKLYKVKLTLGEKEVENIVANYNQYNRQDQFYLEPIQSRGDDLNR